MWVATTIFGTNLADSQAAGLKLTTVSSWSRGYAQFAVGQRRSKDMPDGRIITGSLAGPARTTLVRCSDIVIQKKIRSPVWVTVKSHVAAPASRNSQGLTAKPVREELSVICACAGLVGTGLRVVFVECGGQTWPKNNSIYTNTHKHTQTEKVVRGTLLPSYEIRYEEAFRPWKLNKKKVNYVRFARHTTRMKICGSVVS